MATVPDSALDLLPGEDEIAAEEDAGHALRGTGEAGSLACEEANDAEVGEAGLGVAPLSPDFVDGEAVADRV